MTFRKASLSRGVFLRRLRFSGRSDGPLEHETKVGETL